MESASTARKAIRLGIDLGSMTCRAAYLYPGEEKAVIPVPLSLSRFRPVFPIAETIPTTKMYAARYFPGLVQRLIPEFAIRISGEIQTAAELTQSILEQVIDAGRAYAGAPVEGALVAYPAWLDPAGQDILREAASRPDQATAQIVCGPECMCAHFQAREMSPEDRATVLALSAGYSGLGMAVVRATPRGVRVLAVAGDQGLLAGNVMDFAILQSTVEAIAEQGLPFANVDDPLVWGAFQYAAETAKLAAGAAVGAEFEVPPEIAPGPTAPLRARVVGDVLRSYVQGHVERAWVGIDALLDEAGVRATDLTHVLVEGGSMHLPGVMGALRARFEAVPVHLLSPEAVAAGAAILLADPNAALAERIASAPTGAGRTFMPEIAGVPGLVELLVRAGAAQAPPGRRGGDDARSAGPGGAGEEPGLERLTLAELRQRAEQGDLHGALRDLARLQQALEAELARLTTQVAPGTGVD